MTAKFLEDFSVGDIWTSPVHQITQAEMIEFAEKNDPQPMHTDPVAAAEGAHGTIIASGWQVAALALRLFVESGGYGKTPVLGLGCDELRWSAVVKPDDRLTTQREVIEVRRSKSSPERGILRTRITVTNQHGNQVLGMISTGMVAARTKG